VVAINQFDTTSPHSPLRRSPFVELPTPQSTFSITIPGEGRPTAAVAQEVEEGVVTATAASKEEQRQSGYNVWRRSCSGQRVALLLSTVFWLRPFMGQGIGEEGPDPRVDFRRERLRIRYTVSMVGRRG
jgi:hypothetical protein